MLFAPLEEVQALADKPGQVSEVGIALAPGVDVAAARAEIDRALAAEAEAALSVTPLTEEPGYRLLYDDIEGDQKLYTIFAGLILALVGKKSLAQAKPVPEKAIASAQETIATLKGRL